MPKAHRVLMASDETGFQAAARLLENLPEFATGEVLPETEKGSLTWLGVPCAFVSIEHPDCACGPDIS